MKPYVVLEIKKQYRIMILRGEFQEDIRRIKSVPSLQNRD
jgi:hypothetical protein